MRNLTELSLKNTGLVWYFIVVIAIGGVASYFRLGRMEDPSFTIREMIITAAWPGATAEQMAQQVTDKLEKKLQDTPMLKNLRSDTRAGLTVIHVNLRDDIDSAAIRPTWRDVRNFCEDIKQNFPSGVYGPYYNDRFDDVFGSIYALTGDGFNYEEMRAQAENIRQMILNVPSVQKVELIGVQSEKIYVEIEQAKLTELGINPQIILSALQGQNQMTPSGKIETSSDNVYLRVTGIFDAVESIKNLPINAGGRIFRLADIAKIERRFVEPAEPKMFFGDEPAIGRQHFRFGRKSAGAHGKPSARIAGWTGAAPGFRSADNRQKFNRRVRRNADNRNRNRAVSQLFIAGLSVGLSRSWLHTAGLSRSFLRDAYDWN